MTPSFSANSLSRAATSRPATTQRFQPPPALCMHASCPEFGTRDRSSSSSGMADDDESALQGASCGSYSSSSDAEMVELQGVPVMLEMDISESDTAYRTTRLPQVEFASPQNVILHSTVTVGTRSPSPSPSPSRGRTLARIAGKAKGIARMLSLRKLSRKPSREAPIPLVSSSSAVAVSGSARDGAGGSARRRSESQTPPRRPPISILVTSESRTDAVTYHMNPSARLMSSSSTTGIYTPDDDEFPHDDNYPPSPVPSLTSFGADAIKQLEKDFPEEDRDVFADPPGRQQAVQGATSNRNIDASDPPPAPNAGAIATRTHSAPPTAAAQEAKGAAQPTPTPFPDLPHLLLFMPWCIAVGATITLFPAHIERVVFATGYIPPPSPRGLDRFCFWAETARDYARIFFFSLLSLFFVSPRVACIALALALARFMWVWGAYTWESRARWCCTRIPERLGEDDMESLVLIAWGGDLANLVLRQCGAHARRNPSPPKHADAAAVAQDPGIPQK